MTNHVHLLIQVGHHPLAKLLQNLSFRYTKFINKRKNRQGHLFQGRYKAFLVDANSYLLELVRYIHNNPIRANLAKDAAAYPWTSHRAYSGLEELPWLTAEWVLGHFGERIASARKQYRDFIAKGATEGHRSDFYGGVSDSLVIGGDSFLETVLGETDRTTAPSLQSIIERVCRYYGVSLRDLQVQGRIRKMAEIRGVICWLAQLLEAASVSEIAAIFERDLSTMSRASGNIDRKMREAGDYREVVEGFLNDMRK